jgi:hypothetical protein
VLETWTGAIFPTGIRPAMGKIFVTAHNTPGKLYRIDPGQTAGAMTTIATNLGEVPDGIAFDGGRLWTANVGSAAGSVSIVTPGDASADGDDGDDGVCLPDGNPLRRFERLGR